MQTKLEPGGPTDLPPSAGQIRQSKFKKNVGGSKTEIVIDPDRVVTARKDEVKEETEGSHAFTIGGFSPFTKGHESVVNHMKKQGHSSVSVFTTTSAKRPISAEKKVGYIKKAVGKDVHVDTAQTPLHAAAALYKSGKRGHVTFYGGSDRAAIVDRIKHYNGKEGGHGHYNFKSISFKQVGEERKEGAAGLAGVSGTQARASKSPEELKHYLPKALHPHAHDIFKDINEEALIEDRVVSIQQRMKRALVAKRNKKKLEVARNLAKKRMARDPQLKKRAQKIAKRLLRIRAAGARGAAYNKLSISDRVALDTLVKDKSPIIQKIAKKIVPRVKQREIQRLSGIAPAKRSGVPMTMSYEIAGRLIEKLEKSTSLSRDIPHRKTDHTQPTSTKHKLEIFRKIIEDCGFSEEFMDDVMVKLLEKQSEVTPSTLKGFRIKNTKEKIDVGIPAKGQAAKPTSGPKAGLQKPTAIRQTEEKDIQALREKAEDSGVPFSVLKKIYDRGMKVPVPSNMTAQQAAFARIASFLAKGRAFQKEDADLAAIVEAKATKCGRCGTVHVAPEQGGSCPALSKEENARRRQGGMKKEDFLSFGEYVSEATYQGKKVTLNKPMQGDVKKSKVYVDPDGDGKAKKVNFGDKNMSIKKNDPERRKSFRARHNCDEPGPKDKARYWSCKAW